MLFTFWENLPEFRTGGGPGARQNSKRVGLSAQQQNNFLFKSCVLTCVYGVYPGSSTLSIQIDTGGTHQLYIYF
jgi:hypothetical protein